MKVAVTFDKTNESVFQHFGHCEAFKIYDIEDGKIAGSEVVEPNCGGHGAIAGFLAEQNVNIVICGGLGEHAKEALDESGVIVFSGVTGSADDAVILMLSGCLDSNEANCAGGEGEGEGGCGGGCGSCGGGCGGCGGGAPELPIIFEGKNAGKKVKVHYIGTLNDGSVFDSSRDRGQTLDFTAGVGMMIPGFDKAVVDMEVGDVVDVHIMPEDAYGEVDPDAIFTMDLEMLPGAEQLKGGERVTLMNAYGQPVPVLVVEVTETTITFDANPEMAGKELNFNIELEEVEE